MYVCLYACVFACLCACVFASAKGNKFQNCKLFVMDKLTMDSCMFIIDKVKQVNTKTDFGLHDTTDWYDWLTRLTDTTDWHDWLTRLTDTTDWHYTTHLQSVPTSSTPTLLLSSSMVKQVNTKTDVGLHATTDWHDWLTRLTDTTQLICNLCRHHPRQLCYCHHR